MLVCLLLPPGELNLVFIAQGREEHALDVGFGVVLGGLNQGIVHGLLLADLDALALEFVDVRDVDGVEEVVVLLQHARFLHVRGVRDNVGLVELDADDPVGLGELCCGQADAYLDGALVAVPEAVLGPGQVEGVEEARGVGDFVDDAVVLGGCNELVLGLDAVEDYARAGRSGGVFRIVSL